MERLKYLFVLALIPTMLAGCGGDPFALVSVSGNVKYDDGTPILDHTYKIKFVPQFDSPDGVIFPRVATVEVDSNGDFISATTSKYKDGIALGEHVVYFTIDNAGYGRIVVPEEYTNSKTSPLRVDLNESRDVEIVIPRP